MHTQRVSYVPVLVVTGLTALLAVACGGQYNESNPTAATALTAGGSATALGGAASGGGAISFGLKADKVDVCHVTGNGFNVISVSGNALPAHQAHGDLVVGVDADENCEPLGGGNNVCTATDFLDSRVSVFTQPA